MESKYNLSEVKQPDNSNNLRFRSKSIAHGGVYTEGHPSEMVPSDQQDDQDMLNRSSRDILSLKNSKYMKKVDNIYDMGHLAKKLDLLKMSHMTEVNPDYKLTKNSGFSLNPQAKKRRKQSDDDETSQPENSREILEHQFYVQTTKEEFEIMNSIRKASDMTTLFSEQELSTLTLEQKMLAGLYIPRKKKDPNEIEIVD